MLKPLHAVKNYKEIMKQMENTGLSMQLRLFLFFFLFLIVVMLGVLIILIGTGSFRAGVDKNHALFENELNHLSQAVYDEFGNLSIQSTALSEKLSESLERHMSEYGFSAAEMQSHPELLEPLLDQELERLTSALETAKSSGVFVILDATVNPSLPNAAESRAGLYLKNMEPNIVNASFPNLRFLRGPITVARNHKVNTLPQWKMEFNVSEADYFYPVMATAKASDLPLSRLYMWNPRVILPGNSEATMLCSVPLIDSEGTVFGVCGFEVSAMLFKLAYSPDSSVYESFLCMLVPLSDGSIQPSEALFSGNYPAYPANMSSDRIFIEKDKYDFYDYNSADKSVSYIGLHKAVNLYPRDSAYADQTWIFSLMLPRDDLMNYISNQNIRLILLLLMLLLLSIAACFFTSRKYIQPVTNALNLLKSAKLSDVPKTRIPEIDDLIEYLSAQDEQTDTASQNISTKKDLQQEQSSLFEQFIKNIDTLSTAERAVFNLYLDGYTAKEITDILCLSINTIKTHNKRIFTKLNVTSRKELMIYVQMMEEAKENTKYQ